MVLTQNNAISLIDVLGLHTRCPSKPGKKIQVKQWFAFVHPVSVGPSTTVEIYRWEIFNTSLPRFFGVVGGQSITYWLVGYRTTWTTWTTIWETKVYTTYENYREIYEWDTSLCKCVHVRDYNSGRTTETTTRNQSVTKSEEFTNVESEIKLHP